MIRRYLRRTTFVPSKFLCRILRGRGGLLSFGVNLRVQGLLSVDAFVFAQKCTLITSLSEFISVFKQPTSSVVFRRFKYPQLKFSLKCRFLFKKCHHHQLTPIQFKSLLVPCQSQLVEWRLCPFFPT